MSNRCRDCGSLDIEYGPTEWMSELQEGLAANWLRFVWKEAWTHTIYRHLGEDIDPDTAMRTTLALVGHNTRYKNYGTTFVNWYLKDAEKASQVPRNGYRPSGRPQTSRY